MNHPRMRNFILKSLIVVLLGLPAACGGGGGAQEPVFQLISPFDDGNTGTTDVAASATITTNNGSQPLLFIQGRVINDVDNGLIHYNVKNGYSGSGTLPIAGSYPIVVSGGGAFDIVLADVLRHPFTPFEQEADNIINLEATNRFSPVSDGQPVPVTATVTITVKNGVSFSSPAYAVVTGEVNTDCTFNATAGIMGRFTDPAGISSATLYRVDKADIPLTAIDPEAPVGTAVPFTFDGSTGAFTNLNSAGVLGSAGFVTGASPDEDNNFYIVFDSANSDQLPQPGKIATVPFLNCQIDP